MAEQREAVVAINGLSKTYLSPFRRRRIEALHRLDLTIYKGEIFGLLGPNGSGKTTTMKLILGLIRPTSGSAIVFGQSPRDVETKQKIGFQPEESYLYRILNAEEILNFYGQLFGIDKATRMQRADELIKTLGLDRARKQPLTEYSKGMARRIGLAQALINDPDLVILDEPTVGLDPIGTREIKDLLLDLKQRGKTVLLSSHLLAEIETICDRIAILFRGRLQVCGEVETLLRHENFLSIGVKKCPESKWATIRECIEHMGAEIVSMEPRKESLESLFLKTVKGGDV